MKRILVPLDGSEFAEGALPPALNLARRTGAEVHLATVVSDLPPVPLAAGDGELITQWFEEEEERARSYLSDLLESTSSHNTEITFREHVRTGPVAKTVGELAEELEIDLIALTTHGRGAWQRAWLGSVADHLLRHASQPILLLREEDGAPALFAEPSSPAHVLVPLDGSAASEAPLAILPEVVAPGGGTRVTLVSVLQRPFPLGSTYLPHVVTDDRMSQERQKRMEAHLAEVRDRVAEKGLAVAYRVDTADDAARAILDAARDEDVDLVALSTRGRGGVSRFLLGSVADKVVRGAKVPVLAVRRPDEGGEGAD